MKNKAISIAILITLLFGLLVFLIIFILFNYQSILGDKQVEPTVLEPGFRYSFQVNLSNYNVSEVIEKARLEGYSIRILKEDNGCRNPLPDGGCKGRDTIPPKYEYINVNNSKESSWEGASRGLGIQGDNFHYLVFENKDYNVQMGWNNVLIPSRILDSGSTKDSIIKELVKIGIIEQGFKREDLIFRPGEKIVPISGW